MPRTDELASRFWKALKSDRTMMLGLDGVDHGHVRPMTAMFEDEGGPIWFFTSQDNALVEAASASGRAIAAFASKGHELFATVHGRLVVDTDRAVIERLWNPFVAAWYPRGKDDPTLRLLRLDGERAEIWLNENSLFAGVRMLLGADPRALYQNKVGEVRLG